MDRRTFAYAQALSVTLAFALVVVTAMGSLAGGAASASASAGVLLGRRTPTSTIAFDCARHGNVDIYSRPVSGGSTRRLTRDSHMDSQPDWSPSRRSIAFVSKRRSGNSDIWIMKAGGRDAHDLTPQRGAQTDPAWSPNGKQIAYSSSGPSVSRPGIWIMRSDGANRHYVPHAAGFAPSWSPNGNRIVFVTAASGYELFTITPSGASRQQITSPKGYQEDFYPAWAPDGSWIAYYQVDGTPRARSILTLRHETQRIYLVRPNGTHAHAVTGIQTWNSNPDWSLNSKKLVAARVAIGGGVPRGLSILHLGSGRSHWFVRGQCFDPSWS